MALTPCRKENSLLCSCEINFFKSILGRGFPLWIPYHEYQRWIPKDGAGVFLQQGYSWIGYGQRQQSPANTSHRLGWGPDPQGEVPGLPWPDFSLPFHSCLPFPYANYAQDRWNYFLKAQCCFLLLQLRNAILSALTVFLFSWSTFASRYSKNITFPVDIFPDLSKKMKATFPMWLMAS